MSKIARRPALFLPFLGDCFIRCVGGETLAGGGLARESVFMMMPRVDAARLELMCARPLRALCAIYCNVGEYQSPIVCLAVSFCFKKYRNK